MKIIGLTGPTGAGKSSLNIVAEDFGLKVIDCDVFARKAVEKGSEGLKALVIAFGEDILSPDGTLDRKIMAQKAFSTPENTEKMNKTLLPFVVRLVLNECKGQDVLMDAPTLIESGLKEKCFATIGVLADKKIRLERIMTRDNLDEKSAMLRINAGKPDEFYKQNTDYIIYNNGDQAEFKNRFAEILNEIKER